MAVWFLIHPQGLVLRREGARVALLGDEEAAGLGARESDAHDLGQLEGQRALAAAITDAAPLFAASPFEMRNVHRDLGEEPFRLAGMANQLSTGRRRTGSAGAAPSRR